MILFPLGLALCCSAELTDGVYSGEAKGYKGPVQVEVTVKAKKISGVAITEHREDRPRRALQIVPQRIVAANSTGVDAVSGATITSKAIMRAVDDALDTAR